MSRLAFAASAALVTVAVIALRQIDADERDEQRARSEDDWP